MLVAPWLGPQTTAVHLFSFLAVFIAAWTGGFWAGTIAVPLSIAASYAGALLQGAAVPTLTPEENSRIALFTLFALAVSALIEAHQRVERRLASQREVLEAERAATRKAEHELKNFAFLVQNTNDFIAISDLEFRPTFVNTAGREMVGLPAGELPAGVRVFDFFFPEDMPFLRGEFFEQVRRDGRATTEIGFRHFQTGDRIWMRYNVVRTQDQDGQPNGYATISTNLTERKQREEMLLAADRQKDEFLGMLAHEIRNPLAPMLYAVSALERQIAEQALRRPLDVIGRQVRRMIRIVDDLLDVSRVTHGKISLHRSVLNVADLVTQAVESGRPLLEARNLTLRVEPIDGPLLVFGDGARLGQVLENLLGNASKYTPAGGAVTIAAARHGQEAVLTVRDTGIGIAADMLPRVFDLFAQADTSLDRAEGGLGIGLTLVDRLTRMHGGRVAVHSDGPGRGSTFTVTLPLLQDGERTTAASSAVRLPTHARRILIVDDNVDSAESLAALLTLGGHTTHVVHDGPATLDAVHGFSPDALLLDVGLPGMNGFQVVQQLRSTPGLERLPIVATTGYGRWEDCVKCLAAGFTEHLAKPVNVDDIERILAGQAAPGHGPGADMLLARRD